MSASPSTSIFSKDHPLFTRVVENRPLSGPTSEKDTRHFVIAIGGSGLSYSVGDSLGIYPTNREAEVDEILQRLGATGYETIVLPRSSETMPLREALVSKLALADPTRKALEFFVGRSTNAGERSCGETLLATGGEALERYLDERHFVDLLHDFPSAQLSPQDFVDLLRRLTPRLYSIASSPRLFPDEVHLTISVVRYKANARERHGVCSTYLADRVFPKETPVMVFPVASHFRLPENGAKDVIMIGPGTGIAPFRAFLQERAATQATGRNWLFFGEQRRSSDYLYENELEAWRASGHLARLDLAFSRDQAERVYVQHRMRESAAELWQWIDRGAHLYVCGDAQRMAKDVDATLHEIVAREGAMSTEAAAEYLKKMRKEKRYQRDVY